MIIETIKRTQSTTITAINHASTLSFELPFSDISNVPFSFSESGFGGMVIVAMLPH